MHSTRGPVVVGMDPVADDAANLLAAVDVAAREAIRRGVDVRLVYGRDTLPSLGLTCQILERAVTRTEAAHPRLAVTTAIYPGSATDALIAASAIAGLVVVAAEARLDDGTMIAGLAEATAANHTPVIVVVTRAQAASTTDPASIDVIESRWEPAFAF